MSESFECGDTGALVAYVYDECEPEVREVITAHAARCASCAAEIEGLGWTHQQLGAWMPPLAEVGFRMSVPSFERSLPWWRAPLPAWAQAAAAVLVFGAGLSIGLARGSGVDQAASSQPSLVTAGDAASRSDLARMEQRLKNEMAQLRTAASAARIPEAPSAARAGSGGATMQEVQALVEQSEERQRREFTLRSVELVRDVETQRRVDLASVRETLGQIQGVTGAEVRQQREAIDQINNYLIRVSQQGR